MLRIYHKSIWFEQGAEFEIRNILMDIDNFTFTDHFMQRFGKRKKCTIPAKEDLLLGEIIEYFRDPKTKLIMKFIIRHKVRHRKHDVYYVINRYGKIITTWSREKHLTAKEMLRGKEDIYEKAHESENDRLARESRRMEFFNRIRESKERSCIR